MNGERILGVVLAGGEGSRAGGQDKGLLPVRGEPLVARVLDRLRPQCGDVLIVANRHGDEYAKFARTIADESPGHAGPLAGIAAALALLIERETAASQRYRWLLTAPVDGPDLPLDLATCLQAAMEAAPKTICVRASACDDAQPLHALYSLADAPRLLDSAREALRTHASPTRWQEELGAIAVDFGADTTPFRNLNTVDDFRDYERVRSQPAWLSRIALDEALRIVRARGVEHLLPVQQVPLASAYAQVLAEDVVAACDLPPFANSAMDGFALRGVDLPVDGERGFALIGTLLAGATSAPAVDEGQCVRITTGAPMPPGADTVVIKENARVEGDTVFVGAGERSGGNVRAAGEDFAAGAIVMAQGTRLHAPQLGLLAALGHAQAAVRRRPRLAVIATGDELVPAAQPLGFGQIHESNGIMLAALAREAGAQIISQACVRDDPASLRAAMLDAAAQADLIVSSGGVSAGEADHLPALLAELGEIHFHKVRVKPGMPVLFGRLGASLYFGLPGNPVSAAVTFRLFVRFALAAMQGETMAGETRRARLARPLRKQHARAELLRCALATDDEGVLWATPHAKQGSAMLSGLAESDALALIPEDVRELDRGVVVALWPH